MSPSEASHERTRLLPHQQALVDDFSGPTSHRVALLRAEAGMGKAHAFIALAGRILSDNVAARVLFVVPAPLREQYAAGLRDRHVRTLLVDRYAFRELLDANAIWPEGYAVLVGREFARSQDVLESLGRCRWTLAVIDDAKPKTPSGTQLLEVLTPVSDRLLVSAAKSVSSSELFPGPVPTIDWVRERLVDLDGAPLDKVARPDIRHVRFERTLAEREVVEDIRTGVASEPTWVRSAVSRGLKSGPASLETVLLGLLTNDGVRVSHDADGKRATALATLSDAGRAHIARMLERLEQLQEDSKLQRLIALVRQLSLSRRICILTDSVSTVYSIVTELQDLGRACVALHTEMSFEDRDAVYRDFYGRNGLGDGAERASRRIVVSTRHIMPDSVSAQDTDDLILYDVPSSALAVEEVIGRFDRLGRRTQLTVYEFVEPDDSAA